MNEGTSEGSRVQYEKGWDRDLFRALPDPSHCCPKKIAMRQDDTDGLPDDPWANFAKRDCSDEIATVYETSSAINVDGLLSDPMDTSDGPTDDAILKQQNDIQEEVAKKLELIGDKVELFRKG